MNIYDKTVPKVSRSISLASFFDSQQPVLDILAEMVAYDRTSDVDVGGSATSSAAGVE